MFYVSPSIIIFGFFPFRLYLPYAVFDHMYDLNSMKYPKVSWLLLIKHLPENFFSSFISLSSAFDQGCELLSLP